MTEFPLVQNELLREAEERYAARMRRMSRYLKNLTEIVAENEHLHEEILRLRLALADRESK